MAATVDTTRRVARWSVVLVIVSSALVSSALPLQAVQVPRTLLDERPVGAAPIEVPFDVEYIAVLWDGAEHDHDHGAPPSVRVRIGSRWGTWQPLVEDGADDGEGWASGLLSVDDADAYQVRGVPDHARNPRAAAINTSDGPLQTVAHTASSAANASAPCRSRADWGADESIRATNDAFDYHSPQVMTVHHTASPNDRDPVQDVRATYTYHVKSRGYDDIAYNYLVDDDGIVYEGRWSGSRSLSCLQDGGDGSDFAHHEELERVVRGAHTGNYNSANIGIAVLGTYSEDGTGRQPTDATVEALETLMTQLALRHGIDPDALVDYVNPDTDARATNPAISGHRDWGQTTCPGGRLYDVLPQIRDRVAARVRRSAIGIDRFTQRINRDGALVVVAVVRDAKDNAVEGATVTLRVRRGSDETMADATLFREGSLVTSATGRAKFVYLRVAPACYRVKVREVALDGRVWDGRKPSAQPRTLCI